MKSVARISLGRTAVTPAGLRHLAAFPRLRDLTLTELFLNKGADLSALRGRNLTSLGLVNCRGVDDAAVETVAELATLATLNLNGTAVTDAGVK